MSVILSTIIETGPNEAVIYSTDCSAFSRLMNLVKRLISIVVLVLLMVYNLFFFCHFGSVGLFGLDVDSLHLLRSDYIRWSNAVLTTRLVFHWCFHYSIQFLLQFLSVLTCDNVFNFCHFERVGQWFQTPILTIIQGHPYMVVYCSTKNSSHGL